jgi:O-antigen/teichoic acid export membrane protein
VYGFGGGVSRLLSLFSLPIFTHYLAPDTYGVISMLLVLGVALRIIVGIGSFGAASIVYFRSGDTAHRQQTIWALLLLTVLGGMAMVALAALLSPLGSLPFGTAVESQHTLITIYVAALAVQNSAEPLLMRLQFEENAVKFTVASASGAIAIVGCSMFLVAVPQLGVMG